MARDWIFESFSAVLFSISVVCRVGCFPAFVPLKRLFMRHFKHFVSLPIGEEFAYLVLPEQVFQRRLDDADASVRVALFVEATERHLGGAPAAGWTGDANHTYTAGELPAPDAASTQIYEPPGSTPASPIAADLFVGPKAPAGFETNWLPTMGKKPYLWFRFYAPTEAFWDKTVELPDLELVK